MNDGLVQTLNRLCGATVNTYSFKAKMADLNDALDWYFLLAFKSGLGWEFDDINQTSPPIDTQDIVSGTNRYKIGSFTEKIINLIKLEVDNSAGTGLSLIPETLDSFGNVLGNASGQISGAGNSSFDDLYVNAASGTPTHYVKLGDYIYLRPKPNYSATAGLKAYFNRPASKFSFVAFTITIASPGVVTATAHGLSDGDTVILETDGALPTGLSADTQYYVVNKATDTFQLSSTSGGSAINTTGSQSGNHSFLKTNKEPGIPSVHHIMLCRKAALTNLSYINSPKLGYLPQQVLKDEKDVETYFGNRDKDVRKRLSAVIQNNK